MIPDTLARSGTDESGEADCTLSTVGEAAEMDDYSPWVRSVTHAVHFMSRWSHCSLKKKKTEGEIEENEVIVRFSLDKVSVNGQTARLDSKNPPLLRNKSVSAERVPAAPLSLPTVLTSGGIIAVYWLELCLL